MVRQSIHERFNNNNSWYYNNHGRGYSPNNNKEGRGVVISEWRLALIGLIFSLCVLTAKVLHTNRDNIYNAVFERRLVTYETVLTDGEVMMRHAWTTVLKYSRFWFPALCGGLATWFTWLMVYLDSSVPGVQPPSPLSPNKYKVRSGHTFHLNYVFAVIFGFLVFVYMYIKGVALEVN